MGFLLHLLARGYGWHSNTGDAVTVERSLFLFVSFILFLVSYIIAYFHGHYIAGYFYEVAIKQEVNGEQIKRIDNPTDHFRSSYKSCLQNIAILQILFNLLGVLSVSVWLLINKYWPTREARG